MAKMLGKPRSIFETSMIGMYQSLEATASGHAREVFTFVFCEIPQKALIFREDNVNMNAVLLKAQVTQ